VHVQERRKRELESRVEQDWITPSVPLSATVYRLSPHLAHLRLGDELRHVRGELPISEGLQLRQVVRVVLTKVLAWNSAGTELRVECSLPASNDSRTEPSQRTSVAPSEVTSVAPSEVTSVAPSEVTSVAPSEVTSVAPSEVTSVAPSEDTSVAPSLMESAIAPASPPNAPMQFAWRVPFPGMVLPSYPPWAYLPAARAPTADFIVGVPQPRRWADDVIVAAPQASMTVKHHI
jgi:hypothetical protein